MGFGLKTKNIQHSIRKKNPISGLDIDTNQLFIYSISGGLLFFIIFTANIWVLWKILLIALIIFLTTSLVKKYDDSSINNINTDYGKTNLEWFRIYIKKTISGNKAVDKGIKYNLYQKK